MQLKSEDNNTNLFGLLYGLPEKCWLKMKEANIMFEDECYYISPPLGMHHAQFSILVWFWGIVSIDILALRLFSCPH